MCALPPPVAASSLPDILATILAAAIAVVATAILPIGRLRRERHGLGTIGRGSTLVLVTFLLTDVRVVWALHDPVRSCTPLFPPPDRGSPTCC